jgi:nitrate/nitrite-specific signal transduction histidine kinase
MGLRTMQYRAAIIGATLRVQAQAQGGTSILCFLQNRGSSKAK